MERKSLVKWPVRPVVVSLFSLFLTAVLIRRPTVLTKLTKVIIKRLPVLLGTDVPIDGSHPVFDRADIHGILSDLVWY